MRIHTRIARDLIVRNGRIFAKHKPKGLADRIAAQSSVAGNWSRVAGHHKGINHVIGQKFARR